MGNKRMNSMIESHPDMVTKKAPIAKRAGQVGKGSSEDRGFQFPMVQTPYGAGQMIGVMTDSRDMTGTYPFVNGEVLVMVFKRFAEVDFVGHCKAFIVPISDTKPFVEKML